MTAALPMNVPPRLPEEISPDALVLGIESSCDETSAAVVQGGRRLRSNIVASQMALHRRYGGVVPELASRRHLENVLPVVDRALREAGVLLGQIDALAVTAGPGLIGALLVGVMTAKALALALERPLVGVNHLEGHVYSNFLVAPDLEPPFVCLIVSGGHTDFVLMRDHGDLEKLGGSRDDAAGEAFDKVARLLGLGYPGGPEVERLAAEGRPGALEFPRAWLEPGSLDTSFSGLKTAVAQKLRRLEKELGSAEPGAPEAWPAALRQARADVALAFQEAVADVLTLKAVAAARQAGVRRLVVAGGVAANRHIRRRIEFDAREAGLAVSFPPPALCTDNAAMIASAGFFALRRGIRSDLDLVADPSLSL